MTEENKDNECKHEWRVAVANPGVNASDSGPTYTFWYCIYCRKTEGVHKKHWKLNGYG